MNTQNLYGENTKPGACIKSKDAFALLYDGFTPSSRAMGSLAFGVRYRCYQKVEYRELTEDAVRRRDFSALPIPSMDLPVVSIPFQSFLRHL